MRKNKIYITSFWISFNCAEEDVGVEENVGVGDGNDADFSSDEGSVDDLSTEMCDGGDVIDNNVNDDAINDDGFVDSISTGNINDDEDISDDLAVANTFEKGDVGGNAAAVDTDDNDGFTNNVAADNTTEDWVVGNNPGNDNTGDEDGFVNNFAVDDTTDDKVVCDNATDDANDDKDVGVNVVAFDTVDDEYFSENVTSAVTSIASFDNTADDNHGQKK